MSSELVAIKPRLEELVSDPRLYPSRVKRSASRLLTGLYELGLSFDEAHGKVYNLPPRMRRVIDKTHFQLDLAFEFVPVDVPIVTAEYNGQELIEDSHQEMFTNNNYSITALRNNREQPLRMYLHVLPKHKSTYRLALVTSLALNSKPMLLESLPHYFTSVGFQYNLADPEVRDYLSRVAQTRISSRFVNSERRSLGQGEKTSNGFNTSVNLYLQDAGSAYSDCYEAEAFSKGKKIDPTALFPEAEWQEHQNHHCINNPISVPRIPADMNEVSRLTMIISYNGNSSVLHDLFGDLQLSIDGANQWYAKGSFARGNLKLLFKPEWENNTALVYTQTSQKRIAPKQIYEAVEGMMAVKGTLTERLAN